MKIPQTNGQPYTITEGYTFRDLAMMFLAGLIAGLCLSLGIIAYVGVDRFCR